MLYMQNALKTKRGIKMAKKKSKLDLGKILTLAAALLALVAFFMMFAPAITSGTDISYTGLQVAFGYTSKSEILGSTVSTKVLEFSAYFVPYALLLAGLVFGGLSIFGILPKITGFISAGCYIAAGVMLFLAIQLVMPFVTDKLGGTIKDEAVKAFRENLTLAYGAILAGIFGILAGLAALVPVFLKK